MIVDNDFFIDSVKENNNTIQYTLVDHINGFDIELNNSLLNEINQTAQSTEKKVIVHHNQILCNKIKKKYTNIDIKFDLNKHEKILMSNFDNFEFSNRQRKISNFLCCFNGSNHVSRQFLISILNKTKMWNDQYCTKNFLYSWKTLDGNIKKYLNEEERFYNKFFLDYSSDIDKKIINILNYEHCKNLDNLYALESRLLQSFLNLVSETLATSYYPSISEKFLNSVVTKTIFITYGQPNWHQHLEKYYGFGLYNKIFDYSFDKIQNPIVRVVKLVEMISKFQNLSIHDWHDLYLLEKDTIEYNYNHYYSKGYLKNLEKFA